MCYGHTFDANRRKLAGLMDTNFFRADPQAKKEPDSSAERINSILQSHPDMADIILPLMEKMM